MFRRILAPRTLLTAMAVPMLYIGLALALPTPASAQGCSDCVNGSTWRIWNGRGYDTIEDYTCADLPWGFTSCQGEGRWCETGGDECATIMSAMLNFSEDGTARQDTDGVQTRHDLLVADGESRRTCDGVLLRRFLTLREDHDVAAQSNVALVL